MPWSHHEIDDLTSSIMDDVRGRIAGAQIVDGRVRVQQLGSLRSSIRDRIAAREEAALVQGRRARGSARAVPLPWWLMLGFALSLLGGLTGFVGAAKSYEVARTQSETSKQLDALVNSGAMERLQQAQKDLGEASAAAQLKDLQEFRARAAQAIRDLAELQERTARLRAFE